MILIAEDDLSIKKSTVTLLKLHGYEVIEAADGKEAIDKAIAHRPQIILLDIMMPKLDGIITLKTIRSNVNTKNARVIIVTAFASKDIIMSCRKLGVDFFLAKPYEPHRLIDTLKLCGA